MSTTEKQNPLDSILAQIEKNKKPSYDKKEKTYDLKNYFNTHIKDGVKSANKQIRILPTADGSSPFIEMHGHKAQVDGQWKTFPCLKKEKNQPCPFCEARELLLATGELKDKELAKKFGSRLMYIVKVIDRDNESEGVKFWRFNHDYRNEGIFDKIQGVLLALKKDVTNAQTGRDLLLTINRNQSGAPIVSAVASLDPTVLSSDAEQVKSWLADARTWEDVYSVRNYEYMEIIVKGGIPAWDKDAKKFVDKTTLKADANLESELTVGVENVKSNVKTATSTTTEAPAVVENDLPF